MFPMFFFLFIISSINFLNMFFKLFSLLSIQFLLAFPKFLNLFTSLLIFVLIYGPGRFILFFQFSKQFLLIFRLLYCVLNIISMCCFNCLLLLANLLTIIYFCLDFGSSYLRVRAK